MDTLMKHKTLIQMTSALALLAIVGCSSVKPAKETPAATAQSDNDWQVSDLLVERLIAGLTNAGEPVEALVKLIVRSGVKESEVLAKLSSISQANKLLSKGMVVSESSQITKIFGEAEAVVAVRELRKAYPAIARTKAALQLQKDAVIAEKNARKQIEANGNKFEFNKETNTASAPEDMISFTRNINSPQGIKNVNLRKRWIKAAGTIRKNTGRPHYDPKACVTPYDAEAIETVITVAEKKAVASSEMKMIGRDAESIENCLAAITAEAMEQLGHEQAMIAQIVEQIGGTDANALGNAKGCGNHPIGYGDRVTKLASAGRLNSAALCH